MNKQKFVYFALSDDQKTVKIGSSINPRRRIKNIRCPSRNRVSLLFQFPSDYRVEYGLHAHFGADHIGHEWFHYSENIRAFISDALTNGVSVAARTGFRKLFFSGKWRELNALRYERTSASLIARWAFVDNKPEDSGYMVGLA